MFKVIHNWLVDYLSESQLLSKRQFRFRVRRSTKLAVTLLCDDSRKNAKSKRFTGCVFVGFSKAFDTSKATTEIKCIRDKKCQV